MTTPATPFQISCGAATYEQGFAEGTSDRAMNRRLAAAVLSAASADFQRGYNDASES